MCKVSKFREC